MATLSTPLVDREEASKILKVSTRTLDRYIRKYRFKTRKDGRRVLIKREDLNKVIQEHVGQFMDINLDNKLDNKKSVEHVSNIAVKEVKVESSKKSEERAEKEEGVYKNLYAEAKKELKERQERLDAATYRVGQLESQVKNMVPMLDFSRKEKELKEARGLIELKEAEKFEEVRKMQRQIKTERVAKWIYLSLAGMLLVAEPILFLLWAFS
ncbi:MAG: helix-turn-helix domain-containing protein [Candidatus Peregrinibacteria bacterium]|nr:helix-turn-helix domain-containing protein [Candidatus Peregrinibacteria bacterium]